MITIGLTGGIASGKSTVSSMIKDKGITVIDADLIYKELTMTDTNMLGMLRDEFGDKIFNSDGTLSRKQLGMAVFMDKHKLDRLNEITHPFIFNRIEEEVREAEASGQDICVLDVPILIESGRHSISDFIVLVYADKPTQLKRLIKRNGFTEEEAQRRIDSQMDFEEKRKYADYIIDNSGELEDTRRQLDEILEAIVTRGNSNE